MFPVTEAIGDDVHWCIVGVGPPGLALGVFRFFASVSLKGVREGVELEIHTKRQLFQIRQGFTDTQRPDEANTTVVDQAAVCESVGRHEQ